MANTTPPDRPRSRFGLSPGRRYFLGFMLGGLLLLRMDPFGMTRLTKAYSQDLLAVAMSGCYPDGVRTCGAADPDAVAAAPDQVEGTGGSPVSVVLLGDTDLETMNESWPLSYGFHARVLRAIRVNQPKAVLMDIVFEDERNDPTIEQLEKELEAYEKAGIPIYAATFGRDRPLRSGVREHVKPVLVPTRSDPLDRVTRFYDLHEVDHDKGLAPAETAALSVFREVCGGAPTDIETIRVLWPSLPPKSWNDRWLHCRHRQDFPYWIFQDRETAFRDDCPATPTVPVRTLLDPTEADDEQIEKLFGDRLVLYGANFRGAVDLIDTPLHNDLPGVFLHATALDNLVTFGPEGVRYRERAIPGLGLAWPDVTALVLVGIVSTFRRTNPNYGAWMQRLMRRLRFRFTRVLLVMLGSQAGMLIVLVGVSSLMACYLGLANWVAGFGINFLFAITWTELLEISSKLVEAAEEIEH